jgi:hypothetical protein
MEKRRGGTAGLQIDGASFDRLRMRNILCGIYHGQQRNVLILSLSKDAPSICSLTETPSGYRGWSGD